MSSARGYFEAAILWHESSSKVLGKATEAFADTYSLFQYLLKKFVKVWDHTSRDPNVSTVLDKDITLIYTMTCGLQLCFEI